MRVDCSRVQAAPATSRLTGETQRRLWRLREPPSLSARFLRPHTAQASSWPAGSACTNKGTNSVVVCTRVKLLRSLNSVF